MTTGVSLARPVAVAPRLARLRKAMAAGDLDALVVPHPQLQLRLGLGRLGLLLRLRDVFLGLLVYEIVFPGGLHDLFGRDLVLALRFRSGGRWGRRRATSCWCGSRQR